MGKNAQDVMNSYLAVAIKLSMFLWFAMTQVKMFLKKKPLINTTLGDIRKDEITFAQHSLDYDFTMLKN